MIRTGAVAIIAGALLTWGSAIAEETVQDPNTAEQGRELSRSEPAPAAQATPATDSHRDRSDPFDYEASEQISEDRSVSFPVDI